MPCFRVRLEGSGIQYPVQEGGAPIVGFFTTRQVRAGNVAEACEQVRRLVLAEWLPGGPCAAGNRGPLPQLTVEASWKVGMLAAWWGGKGGGYTFYRHEQ